MSVYICPHCHNPITDDDALLCHFCGESLRRSGNGFLGKMKYSPTRWGGIAVALSAAIFLIWSLLRAR